jgi:ribosomal protein S18 acetylase RimI-like enzyme
MFASCGCVRNGEDEEHKPVFRTKQEHLDRLWTADAELTHMDVQFRTAREEDAPSIAAWFATHAEAVLWGGPKVPAHFDAPWFAREMDDPSGLYRVAHTPDEIVGVYGVRSFAQERRMHILRVAVAPAYRSKGIGHALVIDAISIALAREALTVSLNVYGSNVRALKIYEYLGFRVSGKRDAPEDPSGVSIYMERAALALITG